MGFYVRLAPGLRLGFTERGLRTSIGPRGARLHSIDRAEEPDLHTLLLAIEATDLDAANRDIG